MKKNYTGAYSVLMAFILFFVLVAAITKVSIADPKELTDWQKLMLNVMAYYVGLIFIRTLFHLIFSCAAFITRKKILPLTTNPLVTILVPCYNEEEVIKKAIQSTSEIDYNNIEILLIDDGSSDRTLELAASSLSLAQRQKVRIIHQKNAGKSSALNRGISEAKGEYILCMDADSILQPDVIKIGLQHFEDNPNLAAVAGNVRLGNSGHLLIDFQKLEYITGLNFMKEAQSYLHLVMIVPGPIGLFKIAAVREIGGYRVETYAEDADLTIRLLVNNYKVVYDRRMIAVTEAPRDFQSFVAQRYRWVRGTVQTLKLNSYWLFHPFKSFRNFFILLYLTIETVFIPIANFIFAFIAIEYALIHNSTTALSHMFIQLTLLDLMLTIYSTLFEEKARHLPLLALLNRVSYSLALEVLRFFSIMDEIFNLPMNWNKLKREGLETS